MPMTAGNFVWYELITSDAAAAGEFYAQVAGWTVRDSGLTDRSYTLLSVGDRQVAGIIAMPDGPPPIWLGYIAVDDVDASAEAVKAAGGSIHRAPEDIPNVGRFAMAVDPQGAPFILFKGAGTPAPDLAPYTPGSFGWHELRTSDWSAAFDFYAGLFGWTKTEAMDMGGMGTYQTFAAGADMIGGMMSSDQRPYWLYYIVVEDIDAGAERVTAGGGKMLTPIHPVPGGGWIAHTLDPQAARFAITGPRKGA